MKIFERFGLSAAVVAAGSMGCNVSPAPKSTGGVHFEDAGASTAPGCGHGLAVVTSDFVSTNVAIAALDGTTLSGSFVSSGSANPGLQLALSGDVAVPFLAPASGRLVLLDRFATSVITWMDRSTGGVVAQLPVATGFKSNPHDYVEVDSTHAFVSRYTTNPNPGQQPFDQGGDLLVLDTSKPAIVGRIAIPEDDPTLAPCPDLLTWVGSELVLTLGRWAPDFSKAGDGRFVGVSPTKQTIDWTVTVGGLSSCGRLALSPSRALGAIACSGVEDVATSTFNPMKSDVVVYDLTQTPPVELRRLGAGVALGNAIQPSLAFADENTILALTYGGTATPGDTVVTLDATTPGKATTLGQATQSFTLQSVHCSPGCGGVCLVTDAERNRLRRWNVAAGGISDSARGRGGRHGGVVAAARPRDAVAARARAYLAMPCCAGRDARPSCRPKSACLSSSEDVCANPSGTTDAKPPERISSKAFSMRAPSSSSAPAASESRTTGKSSCSSSSMWCSRSSFRTCTLTMKLSSSGTERARLS